MMEDIMTVLGIMMHRAEVPDKICELPVGELYDFLSEMAYHLEEMGYKKSDLETFQAGFEAGLRERSDA